MKGLIFSLLTLCLHTQLCGQEQATNIKYQADNYTISSTFQTEDRYWYNVYSNGSPYYILVSDGTAQNTSIFNFDGLNILPNFIVDAVKFDGYYYLLVNSGLKYFIIRSSLQNGKWKSEIVNISNPNGKFKISNNNLFFIQKFKNSVFEITGLQEKIVYFRNVDTYDATIEDIEILKDGSQLLLINDKKRLGLSITIFKNNQSNEIFLSKTSLSYSSSSSCINPYKVILGEGIINLYTGQQFFQINIDSLTYKEPLKGQYLADIYLNEENIYITSSNSSETSKIYQYTKSGKKLKEMEVPFRAISKIWDIDNENVLLKTYCSYSTIISYNFKTGSYFLDYILSHNGLLFIDGKLYFTGQNSGNAYLEMGKLPQKNAYLGSFDNIYFISKTNMPFSLYLKSDTLYLKNDIFSENSKSNISPIQPLIQQADLVNISTESNRRLITSDGQYQVDYNYPNNLDFFDGKNLSIVKNENGENIRYSNPDYLFAFKNEYFLLNNQGLFSLKNSLATKIVKNGNENASAFYFASMKDKFFFVTNNLQYEKEIWISDGTKNGTKQINNTNLLNAQNIGLFQGKLHYLVNAKLFSFDGITEKLVGNIGNNYYRIYDKSDAESIFYFFNVGDEGIEVSKLSSNGLLEKIFTLDVFKGIKDIGVVKLISPNIFQIFNYGIKTAYLLKIDIKDDKKYKLLKLDSTFSIDIYQYFIGENQGPYFNAQKIINNWLPNDLRDIYSNNIVKIDNNVQFKPIFQFNSKDPNYERATISNLKNKALIFLGSRKNIWQIDTTTDIATQFIYEKDNLRFYKIIDGKLYLNLCKDGQCHLYRTDGSNKNTYQLTQNPLVVQDMFVLNNELYLYASNMEVGFQIWKIRKGDERKIENLFTEKVEPTLNLNFVILGNEEEKDEKDEKITVFPNPFTEKIDLLINKVSFRGIEVFGINGVKLFESDQNFESSLEGLNKFLEQSKNNIFYLKVKTTNGFTVKKIFKH